MINATYNGQTYQDVTTLVASDGTNSATVTLTESGGSGSIGDFSHYTSIKVTPEAVDDVSFANPYGANTKLIIVTCETSPTVGISHFIADAIAGAYRGINKSSLAENNQPATPYSGSLASAIYQFADTTHIHQCSANVQWDTSTEYTVEIYS